MARGYNASADILTRTADGRDLNDLWNEFQTVVALQNERRQRLINFLTFAVTNNIEDVPQISGDDFEEASEYGEPKGIRPGLTYFSLGYTFKWYDLAARFTWKFLADAPASQVEAINQSALDADNRLVFKEVMRTLFRNTNRTADINGQNYNVYTFYNNDGTVPPAYKSNTFDGTHTHFLASNGALEPADVQSMIDHVTHHGYGPDNGSTVVLMVNPQEANIIRTFRALTNGALYDFVPSASQPALIVPNSDGLLGNRPPSSIAGLSVIGSYGNALIVQEDYVPAGYLALFSTGGEAGLLNPIGFREHANPGLRGLRLVKGATLDYPLIDSFYQRGFGTGVRQRGAAVVMKVTASGDTTYTVPAMYA